MKANKQRMFKDQALPIKGRLCNQLKLTQELTIPCQENHFQPVIYRQKNWLLGLFGNKDGTNDSRYLRLKGEIAAFASECYRMCTNGHSPKYRAVYHAQSNAYDCRGFITQTIPTAIRLDAIIDFFDYLDSYNRWGTGYRHYQISTTKNIHYCCDEVSQLCQKELDKLQKKIDSSFGIMSEQETKKLKNKLVFFNITLKNQLIKLINDTDDMNRQNLDYRLYSANGYACNDFYVNEIAPIRAHLITRYQMYLLEKGFPEMVAMSYVLGEYRFKYNDVLFNYETQNFYKIDHERCLWEISYTRLIKIDSDSQSTFKYNNLKDIIEDHLISTDYINNFSNYSCYIHTEGIFHDTSWIEPIYKKLEFKQCVYLTFLMFVCIPDKTLEQFAQLFFKSNVDDKKFDSGHNVIDYIISRKKYLKQAILKSQPFLTFLQNLDLNDIDPIIVAHNKRWQNSSYQAIQIDRLAVQKTILELIKVCEENYVAGYMLDIESSDENESDEEFSDNNFSTFR